MAATMVMTVTLVIFSTLFFLFTLTNYSIITIQNTVDISVYFKLGLAEQQVNTIKTALAADSRIKEVTYISAMQALEAFKIRHQNDSLMSQTINELTENPLPATLHVKPNKLEDLPAIAMMLEGDQYKNFVDSVNFDDNRAIIDRLTKILNFIVTFGLGLVVVFALIAVLVIYNTITLTIFNRKEEVEIMRLVGATNWYIRGPFLTESILYAIFSTLITMLLFIPVFTKVIPKISIFINPLTNIYNHSWVSFGYFIASLLVLSLLISISSTLFAIRKYLKI